MLNKPTVFRMITACLVLVLASACSVKRIAVNKFGNALASGGTTFTSDEDPELVRDALPFSLKLIEKLFGSGSITDAQNHVVVIDRFIEKIVGSGANPGQPFLAIGQRQRSQVFGRRFRLVRKRGRLGLWQYTLEVKPAR